ncbi:WYL domain-containing protein [Promicromonospora iranensis]|uniref:WYL domain-containing protein n=1 Tax=Promicromonospora iranensis TaxID=1105144 RepID=UPI003CD0CEE3
MAPLLHGDPYGLVAKAGTWYLVADHSGKPRLFRTDRLSAVSIAEAEARRRPGVELAHVRQDLRREAWRAANANGQTRTMDPVNFTVQTCRSSVRASPTPTTSNRCVPARPRGAVRTYSASAAGA